MEIKTQLQKFIMNQEKTILKGPRLEKDENSIVSIIESFKLREKFDKALAENNICDFVQEGSKCLIFVFFIKHV